jgi:hypothetical protein
MVGLQQSVLELLMSPKTPASNKLRLAILYALRYQKFSGNSIAGVVDALIQSGVSADRARVSRDICNVMIGCVVDLCILVSHF